MNWGQFSGLFNYWIVIFLMMTGFYIVLARKNLIKSIIGLNIFQTSVFLLYVTMGKVNGGTAPIIPPAIAAAASHGDHGGGDHGGGDHGVGHHADVHEAAADAARSVTQDSVTQDHDIVQDAAHDLTHEVTHAASEIVYSNPLTSVLMLTAIVVGIATTALALALVVRIREDYGTIDEEQILKLDRGE